MGSLSYKLKDILSKRFHAGFVSDRAEELLNLLVVKCENYNDKAQVAAKPAPKSNTIFSVPFVDLL